MASDKPWRKFYPEVWLSNLELRRCSPGARGIWIDMCCMGWLSPDEGRLVDKAGEPITIDEIATIARETPGQTRRYIDELLTHGVCFQDTNGALFSNRIVKSSQLSKVRSEAGSLGGNPALLIQDGLSNGDNPRSSSFSSSPSLSSSVDGGMQRGKGYGDGFDEFWAAWPRSDRKRSKAQCLAVWKRKGLAERAIAVMAGLDTCKASPDWHKNGGEFIPAPLVWLNQDRWDIDATGPEIAPATRPKIDLSDPWGDKVKA